MRHISSQLFFAWIEQRKGRRKEAMLTLGVTQQVITNWRTKGIPAARLHEVAALLGMSSDEYRARAGLPIETGTTIPLKLGEQVAVLVELFHDDPAGTAQMLAEALRSRSKRK